MAKAWEVRRMWHRRAAAVPAEMPDMLDECAQFLGGQFLEGFRGDLASAPDWVWVSVLAHGSEDLLATCAAARGAPSNRANRCVWDRTLSFLSGVLLDHAGRTGVPVSLLQHDIVVPIELSLGARPLAPPTLVRLVLTGLDERGHPATEQEAGTTETTESTEATETTETTERRA
jgi:hypothetical protein